MVALYHVLNKGVDKRNIFMDDGDRFRFVHDLYEFNDKQSSINFYRRITNRQLWDVERPTVGANKKSRKFLVNIHAFSLMPNHYHLLVSERVENGLPLFMKKLNGGYAKYFNEKHERSGALFRGRYKKVIIDNDAHFIHMPYYIHCNPLDLKYPGWRSRELKSPEKAIKFLENYRWSSHMDYLGIKNFPSVTQREFLLKFFGGEENYKESLESWLRNLDIELFEDYTLEK